MDLKKRLERLGVQKGAQDLKSQKAHEAHPIASIVAGEMVYNEHGGFYLVEERYPLAYQHGQWTLASLLEQPAAHLLPLVHDGELGQIDFRQAVFIDTETTGLAGGTGTYAFLIGIGYFEGDDFLLRQFFMRDYGEEYPLLTSLAQELEPFSALVSFNGRSYDWPLLQTRFVLAQQPEPMPDVAHLDLLHLARRLWRARLASCSLSSLEENILGVQRDNEDVPGWMVPQIYFDYLQTRDARPLSQVFYHNAQDILSLVTLSAYLARIGEDPFNGCLLHGEDFYSLGRFFERSKDLQAAQRAYEHALECPIDKAARQSNIKQLSFLYKRHGQRDRAIELWRAALGQGELYPYIELAKHYEHQERDYAQAIDLVQQALVILYHDEDIWSKQRELDALHHRLERLKRKQAGAEDESLP